MGRMAAQAPHGAVPALALKAPRAVVASQSRESRCDVSRDMSPRGRERVVSGEGSPRAGQQGLLEPPRDLPAVLDRPHPLLIEPARPLDRGQVPRLVRVDLTRAADLARPLARDGLRDDGGMIGLRSALLVVLVVAAAALSACGSSNTSSSSSTTSAATSTAGSGSGVAAATQKCLDATKQIQNASARSTAEQACNQITTSNANVNTALSKAKQACLTAAAKIPIASLKQAAEAQCNKITAQ
jgi:hypothetical protein